MKHSYLWKGGSNMNKVICIGRLVSDPELRKTVNGEYFSGFTLAVNSIRTRIKNERKNTEIKVDEITFLNCKGKENLTDNFTGDIKVPE